MPSIMFLKRFAPPILAGTKRQTIRPPRKRPIKVGDSLSLRIWSGEAYRSRQETLFDTTCSAVFDIAIRSKGYRLGKGLPLPIMPLDDFARADGFEDWALFLAHFDGFYGLPFYGVLYLWEPPASYATQDKHHAQASPARG